MTATTQAEQHQAGALKAPADNHALYDQDLCAWANHNAALLREGRFDRLDVEHIIEELTDMSKSDQRAIYSHLRNLLMHLLKWQFQPTKRGVSWQITMINARQDIDRIVTDSPSLRPLIGGELHNAYAQARRLASVETQMPLKTFPELCPFELNHVLDENWLPK